MKCCICKNSAGIFASGRCLDGKICKVCWNAIPKAFLLPEQDVLNASSKGIKSLIEYGSIDKQLRQEFICSTSYGTLHLDVHHGLLCICPPEKIENGVPVDDSGTIFDLRYISNFSMSMDLLGITDGVVSVLVRCSLTSNQLPEELINIPVLKDTALSVMESDRVKYGLPYGASIIKDEIIRANREAVDKEMEQNSQKRVSCGNALLEDEALIRAKGLFMIHGEYTDEYLKHTRNKLIKVFHPDEGEDDLSKAEEVIFNYELLLDQLNHPR